MGEDEYANFVLWLHEQQAEEAKKIRKREDKSALSESIKQLNKTNVKERKWKAPCLGAICEEDEEEAEAAAEEYVVKKWNKWSLYTIEEESDDEE